MVRKSKPVLDTLGPEKQPAAKNLLCVPREQYNEKDVNRRQMDAVAATLSRIAEPPKEGLSDLVKALGDDYVVAQSVDATSVQVQDMCEVDVKTFWETAYPRGSEPEQKEVLQFLVAAQALYEAWKAVGEPLTKEALTEVDEARRASALRKYLTNKDTMENLKLAIDSGAKVIKEGTRIRRHVRAKTFWDAMNDFIEASEKSRKTVPKSCKDARDEALDPCYRKVWSSLSGQVEQVVSSAADYDVEADKGIDKSAEKLRQLSADVQATAKGDISPEMAKEMFATLSRLAKAVEDGKKVVDDKDNKKKLCLTMVAFNNAFGNHADKAERCEPKDEK